MAEWAYCAGTFSSPVVTFAGEEAGREVGGGNVQKRKPDNGGGVVGRAQTADLK